MDGGAGANTLTVTDNAAGLAAGTPAGLKVANIQTATVTSTGAVGTVASAATSDTAATQQVQTITLKGTYATSDTVNITIGSKTYTATVGSTASTTTAGEAEAFAAISAVLNAKLESGITISALSAFASATAGTTFTIKPAVVGNPLPSISMAIGTSAAGTVSSAATTANVTPTAPVAVAQVEKITIPTVPASPTGATVSIGGSDYAVTLLTTDTATTVAQKVALLLNTVIGEDTAAADTGVITLTAPVAGTPLPIINIVTTNGTAASNTTATVAQILGNYAANSVASTSAPFDVSGFTGLTQLTATSVGGANITAAATTNVTETNTGAGNIQINGGLADTVTGTTNSVYVSGAAGAVKVTTTGTPATGFYIASSTSTGQKSAWGTFDTNKAGIVVTGGTTVNIKETAATITSNAAGTTNSTDVRVGSDANVGITVANTPAGKETIRNLALDPTGDVTVEVFNPYTNASNLSSVVYGTGTYSIYTNGATTATVTGGSTVVVKDVNVTALVPGTGQTAVAGTSKLATVNLNGLQGTATTATLTSDALTNVKVVNSMPTSSSTAVVTINNTTTDHKLALTVGNSGYSAARPLQIADAVAGSVSIASEASAYAAIKTTAINSGSKSFLYVNAPLATSITMTNGQSVDLGDLTQAGYAKVATIDGSAATGGISMSVGSVPLQGLTITTGSGKDTLTLLNVSTTDQNANATSAKTLTVNLGAGDDTLTNDDRAVHALSGATIDGGSGTDTVAASLVNVGTASKFTNFESLGLDLATDLQSKDVTILTGVTGLTLLENSSGTVTYQNVTTAMPLSIGANVTEAAGVTVLSFPTAAAVATTDAYTVTFNGTGASTYATASTIKAGTLDITRIENITIASNSSSGFTANSVAIKDIDARTITVTGSQDLSLTGISNHFGGGGTAGSPSVTATNGNGISTVDASAMTGKFTFDAANMVTGYAGTSILGGTGNDTITLSTQSTVTVNAGAGDDTITTANVSSTLTGGAGNDTFNVSATLAGSTGVRTNITDAAKGDKIILKAGGSTGTAAAFTSTASKAAIVVDTADALAGGIVNAYDLASATAGDVNNQINWFQLNGNTYIVAHTTSSTSAFGSTDNIVKLTGLIDLSKATWTDDGATGTLTLG